MTTAGGPATAHPPIGWAAAGRPALVTTTARLALAAALTALTLGLPWVAVAGYTGPDVHSGGSCDPFGGCSPAVDLPGAHVAGYTVAAAQAPVRVLIVGALIALLLAAVRARTPATRRIARAGTALLVAAAVWAAAQGATAILLCLLAALALAAPPTLRSPALRSPTPRFFQVPSDHFSG